MSVVAGALRAALVLSVVLTGCKGGVQVGGDGGTGGGSTSSTTATTVTVSSSATGTCECTPLNGTCDAGQCTPTCFAGFADCNDDGTDGCESQLDFDPKNCGACGNVCATSDCFQGNCVNIVADAPGGAFGAQGLQVADDHVFWVEYGWNAISWIDRAPLWGGPPENLLADNNVPMDLYAADGWIVFDDGQPGAGISRIPVGGGAKELLLAAPDRARVLDVENGDIYFTTGTDVQVMPLAGGTPTTIASGFTHVNSAHAAGDSLYIADQGQAIDQTENGFMVETFTEGTISVLQLSSGALHTVATHVDNPASIATTSDAVYWVEAGNMQSYQMSPTDPLQNLGTLGRVIRANLDGSGATPIADHLVNPEALALDATHVYWGSKGSAAGATPGSVPYVSDGSLMRAGLDGSNVETVFPRIDAQFIAVSPDAIFISSHYNALILELPKP